MTAIVLAGCLVVALGAWAYLLLLPRDGIWRRTWVAAALVSAAAAAALVHFERWPEVAEPVTLTEVTIGLVVGGAWLVATQVGARVLGRLIPGFDEQVAELSGRTERTWTAFGAVVVMGAAEELLFRGVFQDQLGLVVATLIYAAVQGVERKWALVLAALAGGAVWGGLFAWRDGLVAPVVAHVLWTSTLAFAWPIKTYARTSREADWVIPHQT